MGGYHHVLGKTTELLQTAEHRAWSGRTRTLRKLGLPHERWVTGGQPFVEPALGKRGNGGFTAEAEEVHRRGGDAEMGDARGACAFFRKSL